MKNKVHVVLLFCLLLVGCNVSLFSEINKTQTTPKEEKKSDNYNYLGDLKESHVNHMLKSSVKVRRITHYEDTTKPLLSKARYKYKKRAMGTGFYVARDGVKVYLATAAHVAIAEGECYQKRIFGGFVKKVETIIKVRDSCSIKIGENKKRLNLEYKDVKNDVAILSFYDYSGLIKISNTFVVNPNVKVGQLAYGIGYSYNLKKLFYGTITNTDQDKYFSLFIAINPGDSGGPVYVIKNGKLSILGLVSFKRLGGGYHTNVLGGIIRAKHITKGLRELSIDYDGL